AILLEEEEPDQAFPGPGKPRPGCPWQQGFLCDQDHTLPEQEQVSVGKAAALDQVCLLVDWRSPTCSWLSTYLDARALAGSGASSGTAQIAEWPAPTLPDKDSSCRACPLSPLPREAARETSCRSLVPRHRVPCEWWCPCPTHLPVLVAGP